MADTNEDLPPLKNKKWVDYPLTTSEWRLVKLVHHCLQVCLCCSCIRQCYVTIFSQLVAKWHNELSKQDTLTCMQLYLMLEMLMSDLEKLLKNEEYQPVHDALSAGIALLEKYYCRSDDTDAYFISHGMQFCFYEL